MLSISFFRRRCVALFSWLFVLLALAGAAYAYPPIGDDPDDGGGAGGNVAASPGPPPNWVASVGGISTATGNKFTAFPIVGWSVKRGMNLSFSLFHNSEGGSGDQAGAKWTCAYHSAVHPGTVAGTTVVSWADGRTIAYSVSGSTYTAPPGVYDKLTGSQSAGFTLVAKDQTRYLFQTKVGTACCLSSIQDENGNSISVNVDTGGKVTSVADAAGRAVTLAYNDVGGTLSTVTDPLGRVWTLHHSSVSGSYKLYQIDWPLLAGQTSGSGYTDKFSYNAAFDIASHTDHRGNYSSFTYNADDSLSTETDACGNKISFYYGSAIGANNTIVSDGTTTLDVVIKDPNGYLSQLNYDSSGRLASTTDATGKTEYYQTYDANNNLLQTKDKRGYVWNATFDGMGNPTGMTAPLVTGESTRHSASVTYTSHNQPQKVTDALGHASSGNTYSYDVNDNLLTVTDPLNRSVTLSNYASGLPQNIADAVQAANGKSSALAYDSYGSLSKVTDANGNTASATYNLLGWKVLGTNGFGVDSLTRYDTWGRVRAVNMAPADGLPLFRSDELVNGTHNGAHHYLTSDLSEYVSNNQAATYWKPAGPVGGVYATQVSGTVPLYRFVKTTTNDRVYTTNSTVSGYVLDGAHGTVGYVYTTANTGNRPLYEEYNSTTQQHLYTDDPDEYTAPPSGFVKTTNPVCYVISGTVSVTYDPNGNVLTTADQNGFTAVNTYDADNRLVTHQPGNGSSETVTYTYDIDPYGSTQNRHGLLIYKNIGTNSQTGTARLYGYAYTKRGELTQIGYPLQQAMSGYAGATQNESFLYDANGSLTQRTKRDGHIVKYSYDQAGRLTDTKYYLSDGTTHSPSTTNVHIAYDAADRPIQITDGSGTTSWDYWNNDLLYHLTSPQGMVAYDYFSNNLLKTRTMDTTAAGHDVWSYLYDDGNRLKSLATPGDGTAAFHYDADDRLYQRDNGNGTFVKTVFNAAGFATDIKHLKSDGSTLLAEYADTHEASGRLFQHLENDGSATTYSYDGDYQLVSDVRSGPHPYALSYTYDNNHNRLTKVNNGVTETYTYDDADEIMSRNTSSVTRTYTFDANGNQIHNLNQTSGTGTTDETYDDEDHLTNWTNNTGGQTDTFAYNGLGLRVAKTDSTGSFAYMADGSGAGSSVLTDGAAVYTQGLSETRYESGTWVSHFALQDGLGSTRNLVSDAAGGTAITDISIYDAFGVQQYKSGSTPTPYGFAAGSGYQLDKDSNLILCGHRYYNPATGRFMTSDPAGAGDNWYAYCNNDPLNATDPSGLWPKSIDGIDISGGEGFRDAGAPGSPNNMGPGHYELEVLFRDGEYSYLGYDIEGLLTTITGATYHLGYVWVTDAGDAANWTGVIAQWVDESATFGLAGKAGTAWGDVDSGHGSVGTATLLTAGVIGAVGLAALTDGEDAAAADEAELALHEGNWGAGTFQTVLDSWKYHFTEHGEEVEAESLLQYLRKAQGFNQNLKGAAKSFLEGGSIRYTKGGKYIIKDIENKILSFGSER